jgi:LPXTG-motif cell wall-anchored protein
MINRKKQQKINYYGIKKFKIGAASVMIAAGFVFLGGSALANNSNGDSTSTGDANPTTEVSNDKPQGAPSETPKANGEETGQPAANAPKDESSGTSANNVAKEQKATIKFTSVDPKTKEETDIEKIGQANAGLVVSGKKGDLISEKNIQSRIDILKSMGYNIEKNPFLEQPKPTFDNIDDTESSISQNFTIKVSPKVSTAKKVYVLEGETPTVDEVKDAVKTEGKVVTKEHTQEDKEKQLTEEKIKSSIPTTIGKVGDETLKVPTTVIYGTAPFKREESVDVDVRVLPKIPDVTTTVVKDSNTKTVIDSVFKDVKDKLKLLTLPKGITASVKDDVYTIPNIDTNGIKNSDSVTVEYKDETGVTVKETVVDVKVKVVSSTTEKKVVVEGEKLTADEVKKAVKPSEENAEIKEPKNLDTITKEAGEKEIEVPVSYDNGKLTEAAKVKLTVLPKPLPQGVVAQKNGDKDIVKKRVIEEVKAALVRDAFKEKLPKDAKVSVEDEDKINIPNLDGDNKVDVKIKYVVEGVEKTTTIQVPLRTVEGVTQTVPVNENNEQPDPTKSINRTDYPNDVTFEYKEPVDTRTPGDKNVTVVVRTRDNKTIVEVSAVVRVEKVAGENPAPSEDKKPEEMTPGKENKKPEEMTPGKEDKKPEEMTPGKEDKKPEEMIPGKEDKKPEEMTPGKENKKPEEMTPGKENKKPEEMTPGKENKKPEEMTPGKEDKKPEEMAPGKENKPNENKPDGATPDAGNKPNAGKKEENFNKLKEEALKNINSDDKLTPKEKKDFALLVEKSSATTTFVTKLSDGGEVKVQFDNKNINAKNIKAQLSDTATSEKVRELAKQQLGDKFNVVKTIDLDFVYEKGNIEKKQGDTRTVTVTIGTNSGNEFEVYHLNGNMLEKVPSIYKNGKITFYTNHFSTYTILAKSKEQQNNNSNGKKDNSNGKKDKVNKVDKTLPNTGMTISSTIALGLTLMALAILVIRRKFSK